jgi:hypothetical protein
VELLVKELDDFVAEQLGTHKEGIVARVLLDKAFDLALIINGDGNTALAALLSEVSNLAMVSGLREMKFRGQRPN